MVTTFTISGACIKKAGIGINEQLSAGTILLSGSNFIVDTWINDAECQINVATKRNWTDIYSSLNADVKDILRKATSALVANDCIAYDPSGYPSTERTTLIMDKNDNDYNECIKILKDMDTSLWVTRQ
jgi:hypothetical protein